MICQQIASPSRSGSGARKTALKFTQEGVPNRNYKAINEGWKAFYWQQLNAYFGGKKR